MRWRIDHRRRNALVRLVLGGIENAESHLNKELIREGTVGVRLRHCAVVERSGEVFGQKRPAVDVCARLENNLARRISRVRVVVSAHYV